MQLFQANLKLNGVQVSHDLKKSHTGDTRGPIKYLGPGPKGWAQMVPSFHLWL